jgi:hypothetical protein
MTLSHYSFCFEGVQYLSSSFFLCKIEKTQEVGILTNTKLVLVFEELFVVVSLSMVYIDA